MPIRQFSKAFQTLQAKIKDFQELLLQNEKPIKANSQKPVILPETEITERMVVEISVWSAVKIIAIIFAAYLGFAFLERITSILILLFVSAFFAITLNPGVNRLEKWHIPRGVGCILLMIFVISVFLGILGGVIPIIAGEVAKMWAGVTQFATKLSNEDFSALPLWLQAVINDMPPSIKDYFNQISPQELQNTIANFAKDNLDSYLQRVGDIAGNVFGLLATFFGGIFQTSLVVILTFFLIVDKANISSFFIQLFPTKYHQYLLQKADAVQEKTAEWVHGQLWLFFIIACIAYIGLNIIGVEYALTLALIAGLAEFIPYLGPFIAFTSAAPVAFNDSLSTGVATMLFYVGIQMVEGNIIVPLVMKKATGISPIVTIIAMLIGWEFLGIMGMIISIPFASVVSLFVSDYSAKKSHQKKK